MDNQNQQVIARTSSGHENHGVHVCHTCGWPFPNPHPSAKHRRSHKRVCGTLEGFKLLGVDVEGIAHSNISDDEPSPGHKILEASDSEKSIGGAGEVQSRLEDAVFSDAATKFVDGGVGAGIQGGLNEEKVLIPSDAIQIQSIECGPATAAVKPLESKSESIQVKVSEATASTGNTLGNVPELPGPTSSILSSVSDCQTEYSTLLDSNGSDSSAGLTPIESAAQKDASCEPEKNNAIDVGSDGSLTLAEQGIDSEGKSETCSDSKLPVKILPSQDELESAERSLFLNAVDLTEKKEVINENVHVLSVSDDIHDKSNNAKAMLEDFKDHKGNLNQCATLGFELAKETGDSKYFGDWRLVKELPINAEASVSQLETKLNKKEGSNEVVASTHVIVPHIDTGISVLCHPMKESNDTFNEPLLANFSDGAGNVVSEDCSSIGVAKGDYTSSPVTEPEFSVDSSEIAVNQATSRTYGSYEKIEGEKIKTTGDTSDEVFNHAIGASGVDNSNIVTIESFEVSHEPAKCTELKSHQETGLQNAGDSKKVEIEEHNLTDDACDLGAVIVKDKVEVDDADSGRNALVVSASDIKLLEPSVDQMTETYIDLPKSACMDSRSIGVDTVSYAELGVPDNGLVEQEKVQEVIDLSADSNSQTDSLENNWGSVSVLSIQSDAHAVVDATESQVAEGEIRNSKQTKPFPEGQSSDKLDMFEPPSFMTLVEPRSNTAEQSNAAEIKTSENPQQSSSSAMQAGWFPLITNVVNESQGRKKNEEIIAKVTNWSTGKQHTPLKSLLGEASQGVKAKSPKHTENQSPASRKGDIKPTAPTVNSILAPESPIAQTSASETGKEWNLPAGYPTEIKREKRKLKSRPYWAQFMCCSSVH